jgi:hypothetical protein
LSRRLNIYFIQESISGVIDLEDHPTIVNAVLRYLYVFDYSDDGDRDLPQMVFNVKVYALADKYDIPKLKPLAIEKFEKVAKANWNTTDFALSISAIYESTPSSDRGLRDPAVKLAARHSNKLLMENKVFEEMMAEVAEFGKDLACELSKQLKARPVVKRYICPACTGIWQITEELRSGRLFYCCHCGHSSTKWSKLG